MFQTTKKSSNIHIGTIGIEMGPWSLSVRDDGDRIMLVVPADGQRAGIIVTLPKANALNHPPTTELITPFDSPEIDCAWCDRTFVNDGSEVRPCEGDGDPICRECEKEYNDDPTPITDSVRRKVESPTKAIRLEQDIRNDRRVNKLWLANGLWWVDLRYGWSHEELNFHVFNDVTLENVSKALQKVKRCPSYCWCRGAMMRAIRIEEAVKNATR